MRSPAHTLLVGSWNIREILPVGAQPESRRQACQEVVDTIRLTGMDILAIQELDFTSSGESRTLRRIAEDTDLEYVAGFPLSPSSYFSTESAGVGIASRYPILDQTHTTFRNPHLAARINGRLLTTHEKGLLGALTADPDGNMFWVLSLHSVPYHVFQRHAIDVDFDPIWTDMALKIGAFADKPLIVCGDFNTSHRELLRDRSPVHSLLSGIVGGQATYNGMAADDILVTSQFKEVSVQLVPGFSDHILCLAELEPSLKPPGNY